MPHGCPTDSSRKSALIQTITHRTKYATPRPNTTSLLTSSGGRAVQHEHAMSVSNSFQLCTQTENNQYARIEVPQNSIILRNRILNLPNTRRKLKQEIRITAAHNFSWSTKRRDTPSIRTTPTCIHELCICNIVQRRDQLDAVLQSPKIVSFARRCAVRCILEVALEPYSCD